jgi:transposase
VRLKRNSRKNVKLSRNCMKFSKISLKFGRRRNVFKLKLKKKCSQRNQIWRNAQIKTKNYRLRWLKTSKRYMIFKPSSE